MLPSRFSNGSTPTLELGALQAPGGGDRVPPSYLGAHERGAELGCDTPRRRRIPAPPRASDFGLTYRRGKVSRSPCCAKEKGHCWPGYRREGSQAALPKGAAGLGVVEERGRGQWGPPEGANSLRGACAPAAGGRRRGAGSPGSRSKRRR